MRYFLIFVFLLVNVSLFAQSVPPLDRIISVDIRNATIENALHQVSSAGRFEFSYNPDRINTNAVVTLRLVNTPVRDILNRLFQNQVSFKSRSNHVILVRTEAPDSTPKNFLLDGYILDEQTGERIAQASIFEKTTLASTVSNPFGYYRLRLSTDLPTVRLDVRKQDYVGETVLIRSRSTHSLSIRMTPVPPRMSLETLPIRITEDTTRSMEALAAVPVEMPAVTPDTTLQQRPVSVLDQGLTRITRVFVSAQQAIHDVNLNRDTLYRDWQVSFLPFIGTNHRLSGRISNRISVNMLVGYSFGVRAFELGGLMNLVRTDVQGFQAGGLANLVGGKLTGVQLGGLVNYANQDMKGVQIGGLVNTAGLSVDGLQLAGLVNYAHRDVRGWQISGILNRAHRVTSGHQLGLVNVADTVGNVPIGLLSYVRKGGYQSLEVGANEVNLLNVTIRTGTRRLYNILSAGHSFDRVGSPRLSTGYGLGTAFGLSRSTFFSIEGTYHHLFYFDKTSRKDGWNNQVRLSTLVETKFSPHLSLAFGPSANWYFSNDGTSRPLLQPEVGLISGRTDDTNATHHWGWLGFQLGLRYSNL
ncbi:STN and carboxypeptidase regulatory-like domain-containing protein [Spirosoma litoris]